jgi:copper chaperone NosL
MRNELRGETMNGTTMTRLGKVVGALLRGVRRTAPFRLPHSAFCIGVVAVLAGCSIGPQPIHLGSEECSHCRMAITDRQFAAQALNNRGLAFNFDAIECMADWVRAGEAVPAENLHSLWVTDFSDSETWLRAEDAVFLHSDQLRSPMGVGLSAHADREAARRYQGELGGEILGWTEVLALVERQGGHQHHHHAGY